MTSYEVLVRHIDGMWSIVHAILGGPLKIIHKGAMIRRASLVLMWYITFEAFQFCYKAAEASGWDSATIAACFGILTPVSGLQAAVMKFYNDSRIKEKEDGRIV